MQKVIPSLMFDGKAEEALCLYTSLFKQAEILKIVR
jgi:predicted 3-demethylubiquinone-9 3-methyltransferase (glyoxalase superfamily)